MSINQRIISTFWILLVVFAMAASWPAHSYTIVNEGDGHEYVISDQGQHLGDPRCIGGFSPCIYDFDVPNKPEIPPTPSNHSVPEPTTWRLLLISLMALAFIRKQRRLRV